MDELRISTKEWETETWLWEPKDRSTTLVKLQNGWIYVTYKKRRAEFVFVNVKDNIYLGWAEPIENASLIVKPLNIDRALAPLWKPLWKGPLLYYR